MNPDNIEDTGLGFIYNPQFNPSRKRLSSSKSVASSKSKLKPMNNNNTMKSAANMAKSAWKNASPEFKASVMNKGISMAKGISPNFAGTSASGYNKHSSGYALTDAPDPKVISLDTGVKPNTYSADWMDAEEDICSPLHMSSAVIQIPTYATAKLYDYFMKNVVFRLQTEVQDIISYNLNINVDFTPAALLTGFNSLIYALQIYYYYKSIISYRSEPTNQNEGMIYLRSQLTAQMIEDLNMLERKLRVMPCPPNFNEYIRYMMGNFYSSTSQGSPMIKINPSLASESQIYAPDITNALSLLNASSAIYTQIRKAIPSWRMTNLYDVEPVPIYDANFMTIFANLPFKYYNGANNFVPTVATDDVPIAYNSYTNILDGGAYAMTAAYNTVNANYFPGLVTVPSGSVGLIPGCTRRSYYSVGGVKKFYAAASYPFLLRSRQETYTTNDTATAVVSCHLMGTDRCKAVTIGTITQTTVNLLEFLMSWGTISRNEATALNRSVLDSTSNKSRRRK